MSIKNALTNTLEILIPSYGRSNETSRSEEYRKIYRKLEGMQWTAGEWNAIQQDLREKVHTNQSDTVPFVKAKLAEQEKNYYADFNKALDAWIEPQIISLLAEKESLFFRYNKM